MWAVKVIQVKKLSLTPNMNISQLATEAEMMRAISHPQIIALHDIFQSDDHLFLVMELVSGGDLLDRYVCACVFFFSKQTKN